eukprot:1600511-Pleurochrysis_carterae.AAC.2
MINQFWVISSDTCPQALAYGAHEYLCYGKERGARPANPSEGAEIGKFLTYNPPSTFSRSRSRGCCGAPSPPSVSLWLSGRSSATLRLPPDHWPHCCNLKLTVADLPVFHFLTPS